MANNNEFSIVLSAIVDESTLNKQLDRIVRDSARHPNARVVIKTDIDDSLFVQLQNRIEQLNHSGYNLKIGFDPSTLNDGITTIQKRYELMSNKINQLKFKHKTDEITKEISKMLFAIMN